MANPMSTEPLTASDMTNPADLDQISRINLFHATEREQIEYTREIRAIDEALRRKYLKLQAKGIKGSGAILFKIRGRANGFVRDNLIGRKYTCTIVARQELNCVGRQECDYGYCRCPYSPVEYYLIGWK